MGRGRALVYCEQQNAGWVGPENVAYLVSLIGSETRAEYKIGQGLF